MRDIQGHPHAHARFHFWFTQSGHRISIERPILVYVPALPAAQPSMSSGSNSRPANDQQRKQAES